jgi:putative membrane protein
VPDALVAVALAALAATYASGIRRLWERAGPGRVVSPLRVGAFAAAIATLFVAVGGPLDDAATTSLSAHMVQHVLLLTVAAPLLAISGIATAWLALVPPRRRVAVVRAARRVAPGSSTGAWLAWLTAGVALQSIALVVWHLPVAYDAAVEHSALHALEHVSFLATALLFWWAALGAGRRTRRGWGFIAVFVATLPATALGLLMTIATTPWYAPYTHGSPHAVLEDQQVAGALMWGFGGLAAVVAAVALFASWLYALERATELRTEPS